MIRSIKPKQVIEIGAGRTTCLFSEAIRKNKEENDDYKCNYISIEPYPPNYITPPPPEVTRFIESPLQDVPINIFETLGENDILFIDSSHVARFGSDVVYEYLEILPRIKPGVHIHIHDIFMPRDYPEEWIKELRFFWNEQYLLQAFLAFNKDFEVSLPLYGIQDKYHAELSEYLPGFDHSKDRMQAFWFRRVKKQ